jgi:hypothetical protein
MAIWYFCGQFGIFLPFWYVGEIKIWQPWSRVDPALESFGQNDPSMIAFDWIF